ncbi:MAG: thioredoxin family protein [bacterium]|nr:thioredoxin family protein [bacterium]
MKEKNKTILKISVLIILILCILGIILIIKKPSTTNVSVKTDALKFKEEYESLNNTTRESDGAKYNNVTIPKDNPITYIDSAKAVDIIKNKKAIIYIGAAWCPWCRNAVPVMLDAAKDLQIDTIYYLNLDDEKSNYKIEDGTLVETNHGTKSYYDLLDILKEHLRDYILTDDDGNEYDTQEKRIYMPYVITVKNGKVQNEQLSTVKLNENQTKYDSLTDDQYQELYDIYYKMFDELYNSNRTCTTDKEECS